jgi:hypothetical protein
MPKTEKLLTFDQFRTSHGDALQVQREHLRDDAAAEAILREGSSSSDWTPWSDSALVPQS